MLYTLETQTPRTSSSGACAAFCTAGAAAENGSSREKISRKEKMRFDSLQITPMKTVDGINYIFYHCTGRKARDIDFDRKSSYYNVMKDVNGVYAKESIGAA